MAEPDHIIDIPHVDPIQGKDLILVPTSDRDVVQNLLVILDTKRKYARASADAHALLYSIYKTLWWIQYIASCMLCAAGTALGSIPGTVADGCGPDIPTVIINALILLLTLLNLSVFFATKYDSHSKCYKDFTNLAEHLDLIMIRVDKTIDQLQAQVDECAAEMAKLVQDEEPVPYCVKHRFLV